MTVIADVIVDVPTMQTDQAFTYLVPSEMEAAIQVGMRVAIPFGNGNRQVQGFVMALTANEQP
ncbi:primosomal protein N' family DNA-binding protein, partial [Enterococcus entomosocium]